MKGNNLIIGSIAAVLVILAAILSLSSVSGSTGDYPVDVAGEPGNAMLDGLTFVGMLGPEGKPKDVEDTFVFADGRFLSKECELRCEYPASPYFVREVGNQTEFVSETRCPYKDATIVWRGTVDGDTIKGVSTWTVTRWYWTIESNFEFEGRLSEQSSLAQDSG